MASAKLIKVSGGSVTEGTTELLPAARRATVGATRDQPLL